MAGAGHKTFTRQTLASADVQSYLMDQTVMVFASAAARNAAIVAPAAGMRTLQLDTLTTTIYDGAAWRRVAGRRTGGLINAGSFSTNSGGFINVAHGLGATPTIVHATASSQASDLLNRVGVVKVSAVDATNITIAFIRTDTSAYLASSPVGFFWSAEL
jgi:hypothetical protein